MALYQDYRPKTFDKVIGQPETVKMCESALKNNKVPHALLLSGHHGTGKTTIARLLASGICCSNKQDGLPCGICPECKSISKGEHPDCWELDAASNRGVDDARKINERIIHSPISAPAHILILDEAHMLTREAQNALLKTIEEPKNPLHIFLCTTEPHKILSTIQSRCQRYPLQRPEYADLIALLKKTCEAEKAKFEIEALEKIAQDSKNSFRDALSILDQTISTYQDVTLTSTNSLLKTPDTQVIEKIISLWQNKDWQKINLEFVLLQNKGMSWTRFTEQLAFDTGKKMIVENNSELAFLIDACDKALQSSLPFPLCLEYAFQVVLHSPKIAIETKPTVTKPKVVNKPAATKQIKESATLGDWTPARISVMMPLIALGARQKHPEVYLALRTVKPTLEGKTVILQSKYFQGMPAGTKDWINCFGKCGVDWTYNPDKKIQKVQKEVADIVEQDDSLEDDLEIDMVFEELDIVEIKDEQNN